eukprot:CAMPEP_0204120494 /NCGR_PEP_ID=MMETSP0361-20130328/7686_1 /ASSEMBLY_ACC=CAM_ASM_000343 /TAXON_ID=268821 /ORGANISM="Scrippsiella Hangoei, Strain SHTV-5" /LENGTH=216 /DNA_ID=CAMNT_0051071717 /DNA_START=226 /DNA_END=874 /DNA_ORIENTATION=-
MSLCSWRPHPAESVTHGSPPSDSDTSSSSSGSSGDSSFDSSSSFSPDSADNSKQLEESRGHDNEWWARAIKATSARGAEPPLHVMPMLSLTVDAWLGLTRKLDRESNRGTVSSCRCPVIVRFVICARVLRACWTILRDIGRSAHDLLFLVVSKCLACSAVGIWTFKAGRIDVCPQDMAQLRTADQAGTAGAERRPLPRVAAQARRESRLDTRHSKR